MAGAVLHQAATVSWREVCVHKNARAPLARPFLCIRTHTYKRPQERTHTYTHIYSRARAHTHELKHTDKGVTCRQK